MEILQPKLRFPEFKGNWDRKTLKNICTINPSNKKLPSEFIYIDLDSVKDGVLTKENIVALEDAPSRAQRLLNLDDVLFQMVRPYQKNNFYFGREGNFVASTGYAQLRANENPKFLFQYLHYQNFVDKVIERCTGSNYPAINSSDLANIELKITSLPEQTRIADFLSAVDEKLHLLKEKKALLEEYKKGMMQKIFNQEIRFKDQNGEDFVDWEEKMLSEVATFRRGSFPQPYGLEKWYDKDNGMPFIQVYDVDDNMKLKETTKNKISSLGAKQSVLVKKNNLVITIQGSIGRIAKTQYDAYVDRTLLIFQSYKVPINIDYFKYVVFLLFEIEKEKAPGGIIKTITKEVLSSFNVMIPSLQEQTKIAQFLAAIDDKIGLVGNQIEETVAYKKGLLQQMFI
jgi:type I restriction enzyme S subunit